MLRMNGRTQEVAFSRMTFVPKLVEALNSDLVQAKIIDVVSPPLFDKAMLDFGTEMEAKVGSILVDFKND